ncbi:MAG: sulfite exporter TauE/SafE family protein [Deltaproteobacteria bacterium]|nr:sulfite exporter TauE/SafE family protein [Deltaproteobacteria bacterium]
MSYIIICTVALLVSGLTLFSGFGLGTLLMPAFALFFPVEVAIAATAIVHLANNLFKVGLVGRKASPVVILKFALPAAVTAMIGALLLNYFATVEPIAQYTLFGWTCSISLVNLVIAVMIMGFAVIELHPVFERLAFSPRFIPLGGALSGFFGGLSGHQGALRTAFLIRAGLDKEVFIGTMVVSAVVVDVSRLLIYGATFFSRDFATLKDQGGIGLVIAGSLAAFAGAFIASRFLKKITMRTIQIVVGAMLFFLSIAIGLGII